MEKGTYMDEYEKLLIRMSKPRVVIDNAGCSNATRIMIDTVRKHGILLEAVRVLTDLDLSIKKAYICSDGRWFMDVFHVTDLDGNKLTDDGVLGYIEKSLERVHYGIKKSVVDGFTVLELTGTDRIGLLSEVFAVLSDLQCNIVESKVWTHNGRIASLIYLKDNDSGCPVEDSKRLDMIESMLRNVLKGHDDIRTAKTSVSSAVMHTERRLHQMMSADRDYDMEPADFKMTCDGSPVVMVQNYLEKDYTVVKIQCKDRTKLLFDVVCTFTDMQYIVFHATVDTSGDGAYLEFFIRHTDGTPISLEAEKQRLIQCLQASIKRRALEGVRLELSTSDRKGLLADVTRTFCENGLNITRAEVSTKMDEARNIFYVTDVNGNQPDAHVIESVREKIGACDLKVKELPMIYHRMVDRDEPKQPTMLLSLGSMVRRNLYNLGWIKSYY